MPRSSNSTYGRRSKYESRTVRPPSPGSSGKAQRIGCDTENTQRPPRPSTRAAPHLQPPLARQLRPQQPRIGLVEALRAPDEARVAQELAVLGLVFVGVGVPPAPVRPDRGGI